MEILETDADSSLHKFSGFVWMEKTANYYYLLQNIGFINYLWGNFGIRKSSKRHTCVELIVIVSSYKLSNSFGMLPCRM